MYISNVIALIAHRVSTQEITWCILGIFHSHIPETSVKHSYT